MLLNSVEDSSTSIFKTLKILKIKKRCMIISPKIVNRNKIFSRLSIVASTLIAWCEGIGFFSLNMKLNVYEETEIKKEEEG